MHTKPAKKLAKMKKELHDHMQTTKLAIEQAEMNIELSDNRQKKVAKELAEVKNELDDFMQLTKLINEIAGKNEKFKGNLYTKISKCF